MLGTVTLLSRIDLKTRKVAIAAVGSHPHFDATLCWFEWHVLFQGRPALKLNHGLIDGDITVRLVNIGKLCRELINEWSHLTKSIMALLSTWY